MELLAPAGNRKNFMAALEAGANAIYLGGKVFNARARANNFSIDELEELIKIAHILNVAVYVTVNILIADSEIAELEKYLKQLDRIGVDAIIVQDLATLSIARQIVKNMEIHGSTQMTASNLATVNFLYEQGMTRVVLSRELSLSEIKYICQNTKAEIEVFIHGALCICYSGQCLMSSFIGGRSGNRGACAQPCRLPYELIDGQGNTVTAKEENYIMSPKDLNYAKHMEELIEAGVASFKVEGRMKKVSYVREVIGSYREIIDKHGKASKKNLKQLESGFNRGFSTSYLDDNVGRKMMTVFAPNNQGKEIGKAKSKGFEMELILNQKIEENDLLKIINDDGSVRYFTVDKTWQEIGKNHYLLKPEEQPANGKVYLAAKGNIEAEHSVLAHFNRKIPVYAYLDGQEGTEVSCTLMTENGETITVKNEYKLQKANNKPTSIEKVTEQIGRMGNTVFVLQSVSIPEGPFMWPASVLNQLRRDAVVAMENLLLKQYLQKRKPLPNYDTIETKTLKNSSNMKVSEPKITVQVDEIDGVKAAIAAGADNIIFGGDRLQRIPYQNSVYKEFVRLCKAANVTSIIATPRIVKADEEKQYKNTFRTMLESGPDAISIHFLGALLWIKEFEYTGKVYGDISLNTFNAIALKTLASYGISKVTLSEEMTMTQIRQLQQSVKSCPISIEVVVQGKIEMMISEYCVINAFADSGNKNNCSMPCLKQQYSLKDRKGELFPLRTDPYCRMHIMNSRELDMRPYIEELKKTKVNSIRIEASQTKPEYIKNIIKQYKGLLDGSISDVPKTGEGITRGHYFKGIL